MSQYTFGSIIPLIGGMTIAASQVLGRDPEYIASWGGTFGFNDSYCLKYYDGHNVPYYELDNGDLPRHYVDIVTCLPPCAGLSTANTSKTGNNPHGCNAPSNEHMIRGAEQALMYSQPRCMIVENAPKLFTPYGVPFADRIVKLANFYGYTMSMIKTNTMFHGIPQSRPRTFYFLWKGDKAPIMQKYRRPSRTFHEMMRDDEFAKSDSVSKRSLPPSADPLWLFLEHKNPGLNKQEIFAKYASEKSVSTWMVIWKNGWLDEAIAFVDETSYPKENKWLKYAKYKKSQGLGVMDAHQKLTWNLSRSLMWQSAPHMPHPYEDRWLTVTETLALMGFPSDFYTKAPISGKDSNIIFQNCPVCTASVWLTEIIEAFDGNREWVDIPQGQILRQSNVTIANTMKPVIS